MFIAIIGTPSAGKQTLLEYLVTKHGFAEIGLDAPSGPMDAVRLSSEQIGGAPHLNNLRLSDPSLPPTPPSESPPTAGNSFSSPALLLDHVTHNWLNHTVTTDLRTFEEIEPFLKRPFFLLVAIDGPLRHRFERERERSKATGKVLTIDEFVEAHDLLLNGPSLPTDLPASTFSHHPQTDFSRVMKLANVSVCNNLPSIPALHAYLDQLNLLDEERLRPGWDTYFMTLASLASHRSNCMKRRVGALLVRSKRILSTGYNGTPRGIRNCNQGGCRRCNGTARGGESLDECLCLHAEENALLEAGRERIGDDSVIYCNTCPCLRCSVKIVQTGVREVVYNQSYSMDAASAMVLKEGGVILRQLHMPS